MTSKFPYGYFSRLISEAFLRIEHYVLGKPITTIASEIGCDQSLVFQYGKKYGFKFRKNDLKMGRSVSPLTTFKKGLTPWNKGKTGYPFRRIKPGLRGSLNPNWKGGCAVRPHTDEVKAWRLAVYTRDNFTCTACGKRGGKINAHHIKKWSTHPELRLEVTNGQTLCLPCHWKMHRKNPRKTSPQCVTT